MPETERTTIEVDALNKTGAGKGIVTVPQDRAFWSRDGRILRDLKDLMEALEEMSDQTFAYHANAIKNDFSNWVKDILKDDKLAESLEKASNREQAARLVREWFTEGKG